MEKDQLIELKEQIDTAKQQVSQLEGRKDYLMQQLKEQWKCTTISAAEKKVKELEKEISDLDTQIQDGVKELEEKYEFN